MPLTADDLATVSRLWDRAQTLTPARRLPWAESLADVPAAVRTALCAMLRNDSNPAADDTFMQRSVALDALKAGGEPIPAPSADAAVGPYRLVREIGSGGMGTVWLAERADGFIRRPVALKLPHPWLFSPALRSRFERERDILAALTHPHIARLYDAGVSDRGQPYLAMEYIDGEPLTAWCEKRALPLRDRLALMRQVLAAVKFAQSQGIAHRDLKPSNILVSADGQAHLLDFGIATLLEDGSTDAPAGAPTRLTQFGLPALTPGYASPEQIRGEAAGVPADVYSLGVLLYELITGRLPYRMERPTRQAMEAALLQEDPPAPGTLASRAEPMRRLGLTERQYRSALGGDLDTIVMTALQVDPARRYRSAEAFDEDLRRHEAGERVLARPDSLAYRTRRLLSRHRVVAGATAVLVIGLSAALAAVSVSARHAREQERIATEQARTTEAVIAFLRDLFTANAVHLDDPLQAQKLTARELLDIGAQRIDASLTDAPRVKLRMYETLDEMYGGLALNNESLALSRKRVALARTLTDDDGYELASSLVGLATALGFTPDQEASLAAAKEAVQRLEARGVHDRKSNLLHGHAEMMIASALMTRSLAEAWQHQRRAMADLQPYPDSREYAMAALQEAYVATKMARWTAASEALDRAGERMAKDDPNRISLISMRCQALWNRGEAQAAEGVCKQAVEVSAAAYGNESEEANTARDYLVGLYLSQGRAADARALLEWMRPLRLKSDDPMSGPVRKRNESDLALIELARGRLDAAKAWIDGLDRTQADRQLVEATHAAVVERPLATWLIERGRFDEAAEAIARGRGRARGTAHEWDDGNRQLALAEARLELLRGRPAQAQALADAAVAAATLAEGLPAGDPLPPLSAPMLAHDALMAEVRLAQGRLAEADELAAALRQRIDASRAPADLAGLARRAALVSCRADLARGRPAEAAAECQAAARLDAQAHDPRSPQHLETLVRLGEVELALQHRARAAQLAAEAAALAAALGPLGPQYTEPLAALKRAAG